MSNPPERWEGIHAIPVTPFTAEGAVDKAALKGVVAGIVASGIDVVVACGNTSEYVSLTSREADDVAAATLEACAPAATLVGVGGALDEAVDHARTAISLGAAGVMIHFPSDPYLTDDGLARYYKALATTVDGVVVVYVRGQGLPPRVLEGLASLENVVAIKYARPDVIAFGELAQTYGRSLLPICGLAEMWAPFFWLAGARGFTSGLVNVAPTLSITMLESLRADDFATTMELWRLIAPFERLRCRESNGLNVPVVKEAMVLCGLLQNAVVRPPISALSTSERTELEAILAGWPSPS